MRIGEVMMQRQRNVRHNHRTRTIQFDLFAAPGGEAMLTPAWGALPEETRFARHETVGRIGGVVLAQQHLARHHRRRRATGAHRQ
jgi:hypothetical protein